MKKLIFVPAMLLVFVAFAFAASSQRESDGVPVQMVVTVQARHGSDVPVIYAEDVMVYEGKNSSEVTEWVPLQGSNAGLDLYVLIDDAANTSSVGLQLEALRKFINAQPATTAIGVGYMRYGTAVIAQELTNDRVRAARALRLPTGDAGASASPYFSISDLIKRWPQTGKRREILMITDGFDRFYGTGAANPYVETAIEQAQRAGILIYSIYTRGAGGGRGFWRLNWGQNYLSQVSDETGGEAYYIGSDEPVSFVPYLDDLAGRLSRQYLLTFLAKPENEPRMQSIKLRTEVPNAELIAADRVYVPAGN